MRHRPPPHRRVRMGERAELVRVVLKHVRIDRADPDAQALGKSLQLGPVVHTVPGNVQRDARGDAAEFVDDGGVGDLFIDGRSCAWIAEGLEARA